LQGEWTVGALYGKTDGENTEDGDNYNVLSKTALISALSDYLSLKASYVVKYDSEPVRSTLEETDTILSVTLVVSFYSHEIS
jgi:putative salt-induced outer membrane protein YdiY